MVDLDYCKSRGITVCNVCDYCTDAVAQHTFALTFFLLEKLRHYDDYVKSGQYGAQQRFSNFDFPYYELAGKTWGIIGMGHIGRRVASIASAFGCKVIFYSASGNSTCTDYERTELIPLLESSDIISLHCPLSDKTFHLIHDTAFCHMRPSSILINVARAALLLIIKRFIVRLQITALWQPVLTCLRANQSHLTIRLQTLKTVHGSLLRRIWRGQAPKPDKESSMKR